MSEQGKAFIKAHLHQISYELAHHVRPGQRLEDLLVVLLDDGNCVGAGHHLFIGIEPAAVLRPEFDDSLQVEIDARGDVIDLVFPGEKGEGTTVASRVNRFLRAHAPGTCLARPPPPGRVRFIAMVGGKVSTGTLYDSYCRPN